MFQQSVFPSPLRRPAAQLTIVLSLFAGRLAAQDAPQASEGEIITLSPFEVVANDDGGYVADRSTTGSRVAADLRDLPYALNVVTDAFLEDFVADTMEEQFAYVSSFAPEEDAINAYSLRGFRTNFQLRDGFARSGFFSKATTSRIEVIKGPAAAIYGRTQPGGVINYISKRPQDRARTQLTGAVGSDDYRRVTFNTTGPVYKTSKVKLRYRVDADYRYEEYGQAGDVSPFTEERVISTVWDLTFNGGRTSIRASADHTDIDRLPLTRAPLLYDPTANTAAGEKTHLGIATGLDSLGYNNIRGTGDKRTMDSSNVVIEHRLTDHINLRLGGDYADREYESRSMDQFVRRFDINTRGLTGRQPQLDGSKEMFRSVQADIVANFRLGPTENKLLFTGDYFNQRTGDYTWRLNQVRPARVPPAPRPLAAVNDPDVNETYMPGVNTSTNEVSVLRPIEELGHYFPDIVPGGVDSEGRPFQQTTENYRELTTRGIFASWRMSALRGRLVTLLGGRYEKTSFTRNNVGQGTFESYPNDAFTPSLGANFYITKDITLFSNYSESYYPTLQTGFDANGDAIDGGLPNEKGEGVDIGAKVRTWGDRLNFSVTYFTLKRRNVAYLVDFPAGTDGANASFDQRYATAGLIEGQGVELDGSLQLKNGLTLFGSYTYNDTVVKEAGYDLDLVGRRWQRAPSERAALGFNFRPRGDRFKGISLVGGVRYEGDSVYDNGSAVRLATDGPLGRSGNDGRREILNPSYVNVDLGMSYEFRARNRWRHRVQFNVKNVTNDDTLRQSGLPAPPQRFILSYRVEI